MSILDHMSDYPLSNKGQLLAKYAGKKLADLPVPAVVLDRAKLRKNCNAMLEVCETLGVGFRGHVKSHKTMELAHMQVGEGGKANFIVSTLIEAEHLKGFVKQRQARGDEASILYGVPVAQSHFSRIAALAGELKLGTFHVIIDNIDAFNKFRDSLSRHTVSKPVQIGVFIKIDTGYHRAGVKTTSPKFSELVNIVLKSSDAASGLFLKGFYSHYGHSYAGDSTEDAAHGLIEELTGLEEALKAIPPSFTDTLILSVGATPTATAAQNMLSSTSPRVQEFQAILQRLQENHHVELHAGVYPLLDCQQVATHARPSNTSSNPTFQPLTKDVIAIKLLAEITSIYTERSKPECLISAGSLALGREPCKSYPGWGIVTSDMANSSNAFVYEETGDKTGWIVGRISQEHAILTWEGEREKCNELKVGDRVMVWPNHACVAGVGFGWYFVVDGEGEGRGDEVVDVWVRWRGW